jgi:hypothetical protein
MQMHQKGESEWGREGVGSRERGESESGSPRHARKAQRSEHELDAGVAVVAVVAVNIAVASAVVGS